jgi:hypothetical protein
MRNFHLPLPERHDAIAAYSAEVAGTQLDLDPELEAAAIDHLLDSEP